jgi:hypothetical protein
MYHRADYILHIWAEVNKIEGTFCENVLVWLHQQMEPAPSLACGYTLSRNTSLHNQTGNDDLPVSLALSSRSIHHIWTLHLVYLVSIRNPSIPVQGYVYDPGIYLVSPFLIIIHHMCATKPSSGGRGGCSAQQT